MRLHDITEFNRAIDVFARTSRRYTVKLNDVARKGFMLYNQNQCCCS